MGENFFFYRKYVTFGPEMCHTGNTTLYQMKDRALLYWKFIFSNAVFISQMHLFGYGYSSVFIDLFDYEIKEKFRSNASEMYKEEKQSRAHGSSNVGLGTSLDTIAWRSSDLVATVNRYTVFPFHLSSRWRAWKTGSSHAVSISAQTRPTMREQRAYDNDLYSRGEPAPVFGHQCRIYFIEGGFRRFASIPETPRIISLPMNNVVKHVRIRDGFGRI